MSITIRYYGLIADLLKTNEEKMIFESSISINELINMHFLPKFDQINPIHSVAINNTLAEGNTAIKNGDVIDLMPAFAGG